MVAVIGQNVLVFAFNFVFITMSSHNRSSLRLVVQNLSKTQLRLMSLVTVHYYTQLTFP